MSTSVITTTQNLTTLETTDQQSTIVETTLPGSGFPGWYGSFYDTTTHLNPAPAVVRTISLNTTLEAHGCAIVDGSKIRVTYAGVYNLQLSIVVAKTDAGEDDVDIWIAKNGTDLPDSNTRATLTGNGISTVLSWNYMTSLAAGDYLELRWYSADIDLSFPTSGPHTAPTRPRIPAIIATICQVAPPQGI